MAGNGILFISLFLYLLLFLLQDFTIMLVVYFRNCAEMDVAAALLEAGRRVENNTLHVPMRPETKSVEIMLAR